jgi:hypothetical protein
MTLLGIIWFRFIAKEGFFFSMVWDDLGNTSACCGTYQTTVSNSNECADAMWQQNEVICMNWSQKFL